MQPVLQIKPLPSPPENILRNTLVLLLSLWLFFPAGCLAAVVTDPTELNLEELLNIQITSVSKKPQEMSEAAAAIFVLTAEDIRRSGANSIPEALRMVPGLEVARINASQWAITARGFNGTYANKLLVLIDGRSVYTSTFGGVYWDEQDMVLEDIERIEVIRGPGASLWGANALNGVINVISKKAADTQGLLVSAGGGSEEKAFGTLRYGGRVGDRTTYRVYAKYFDRDEQSLADGRDAGDGWDALRGGFRLDWDSKERDLLTLQGDLYSGNTNQNLTFPGAPFPVAAEYTFGGGNLLGRWTRTYSGTSDLSLQAYYDRALREELTAEQTSTFDLDLQHHFAPTSAQEIIWGLGYRLIRDDFDNSVFFSLDPDSRTIELFSAFIQDEIELAPDQLKLTLGCKLEHNDYTGLEIQPNARLAWTPQPQHTLWASVSRAVRTPSRVENDVRILISPTPQIYLEGNRDLRAEELVAYELGWRDRLTETLSLDVSFFYNDYNNIITTAVDVPVPPPPVILWPFVNNVEGEVYGGEIVCNIGPLPWWRLQIGYSYEQFNLHGKPGTGDETANNLEAASPQQQMKIRSMMTLPGNLEFDQNLYHVGALSGQGIPAYTRLDMRLGWHPTDKLELSLAVQNLLDDRHPEFDDNIGYIDPTESQRSAYLKCIWRY